LVVGPLQAEFESLEHPSIELLAGDRVDVSFTVIVQNWMQRSKIKNQRSRVGWIDRDPIASGLETDLRCAMSQVVAKHRRGAKFDERLGVGVSGCIGVAATDAHNAVGGRCGVGG